jgi:hypothetical protein
LAKLVVGSHERGAGKMAEAKVKQAPRIDNQTTIEEMTKYWKELYNERVRIESRYPFIVTTVVTLFVGSLAAENIGALEPFRTVAPYIIPMLLLILLSYICRLFRDVAILQGYLAFVEDEINAKNSTRLYIWNSKYIDRFAQNNGPNKLLMICSVMMLIVSACVLCVTFPNIGIWLTSWYNAAFCFLAAIIVGWIFKEFMKNDEIRHQSYEFAVKENHPELCGLQSQDEPVKKQGSHKISTK